MKGQVASILIVIALGIGAGVGYYGGVDQSQAGTSASTLTSTFTTTRAVIQTKQLPTNATVCEGIGSCGGNGPIGPVQFTARYNLSVDVAGANNAPPTCQSTEPNNGSFIELVDVYSPNNATLHGITFWISNQLIKQNLASNCTFNIGSPEYIVETGIGDTQAHGYAGFSVQFNMTDCASGELLVPCAFQLYSLGNLNPA